MSLKFPHWREYAFAGFLYLLLVFIGFLPYSLHFFSGWVTVFEDPSNAYRVWWFSRVIFGGEGSIWFMPDLLYPHGLKTMQASNGIGKELLAALLGGGNAPWLAMNAISLSTPVTCGLAAFAVLRRLLHGAFLPALAGGWLAAWSSCYMHYYSAPWMASSEGLIVYVGLLLLMRQRLTWSRAVYTGVAAGVAAWLQLQMTIYLVVFGLMFLMDRVLHRQYRALPMFGVSTLIGAVIAAPLIHQVMLAYEFDFSGMAGETAGFDYFYFRNRLSSFILPAEHHLNTMFPTESLLGRLSSLLRVDGTLTIHTATESYLGWVMLILAYIGVRSRRRGTGFLVACALVFGLLSMGPTLTTGVGISAEEELYAREWLPGPWLAVSHLPPFNSLRTPMRLVLGTQLCLAFLATYGLLEILRAKWPRASTFRRVLTVTLILAAHMADVRAPLVFWPSQHTPFYDLLADDPEKYVVLDLPYERGAHQYMHSAAYHQKRTPFGFGSRVPTAILDEVDAAFRFPLIAESRPQYFPRDYDRFAENLVKYDVRYLIVQDGHFRMSRQMWPYRAFVLRLIENPDTWANQPWIERPRMIYSDEIVRVYAIIPRKQKPPAKEPSAPVGDSQ